MINVLFEINKKKEEREKVSARGWEKMMGKFMYVFSVCIKQRSIILDLFLIFINVTSECYSYALLLMTILSLFFFFFLIFLRKLIKPGIVSMR